MMMTIESGGMSLRMKQPATVSGWGSSSFKEDEAGFAAGFNWLLSKVFTHHTSRISLVKHTSK